MRKINLDPYNVPGKREIPGEGDNPPRIVDIPLPYDVRTSIVNSLYGPEQRLGAMELLNNDRLAQKIKQNPGNVLLLEEEEYSRVRRAFEVIHNFTQNDVELVRRVMEAPEIPVKEG